MRLLFCWKSDRKVIKSLKFHQMLTSHSPRESKERGIIYTTTSHHIRPSTLT